MAVLKRSREIEDREVETLAMANCLMLLSARDVDVGSGGHSTTSNGNGRVFRCKTCDREFPSFQALGGHRASHKKPKLLTPLDLFHSPDHDQKPKTHECSICGLEFAVGQALGGHMRRHRGLAAGEGTVEEKITSRVVQSAPDAVVPVIRKSNSKRVLCLDLNLTPYENDLKLEYQVAPFLQLGF